MNLKQLIQEFEACYPAHLGHSQLLSQKDLDQGDTLQRESIMMTLLRVIFDLQLSMKVYAIAPDRKPFETLKAGYGTFRRSPDPEFWGYDPDCTSRDQMHMAEIALSSLGTKADKKLLREIVLKRICRFGFHQNIKPGTGFPKDYKKIPDITSPSEVASLARGILGSFSYLVTLWLDLVMIIDVLLLKKDSWDAHNMLATQLLHAEIRYPTPFSKLAMMLFLKTNFMERLWNYHKDSDGNNGCEPLYWLFRIAFYKRYGYQPTESP